MEPYRVSFVCTGNACRSPFAECVLRTLLESHPELNVEVESCGTLKWGNNPRDYMMCRVASTMGYDLTGRTRHMDRMSMNRCDLIIAFEPFHRDNLTMLVDYAHWNRIVLFNKLLFGVDESMPDPHGQTEAYCAEIARLIETGCKKLVEAWLVDPPQKGIPYTLEV